MPSNEGLDSTTITSSSDGAVTTDVWSVSDQGDRLLSLGPQSPMYIGAASFAVLGGLSSILGWVVDSPRLTDWFNLGVSTQPNTGLLATLCGLGLLLISFGVRVVPGVLGLVALVFSGLILLQHLFGWNLGFDHQLTFERSWGQSLLVSRGRIGPPASFCFTIIGFALMVYEWCHDRKSCCRIVPLLGIAIVVVMLFSLFGYLFGAKNFYSIPGLSAIAFQTALLILSLGIALIVAMPQHEPMRTLCSDSRAAMLARIVLPALIAIPILLDVLRVSGEAHGFYDSGTGRALAAIVGILATVGLMWWTLSVLKQREQRELTTSQRLAGVLGSITDGLVTIDKDWRFTLINDEMVRRLGTPRSDILGKLFWAYFPYDQSDSISQRLQTAMRERVPVEYEYLANNLDRWFRDKAYPTDDGGLAIYSQDITERKLIDTWISNRAQQFETLIGQAPIGVYLVDADFRLAQLNPIALPVFGEIPGGLIGRDFDEVAHILWDQSVADSVVSLFRNTMQTGEPYVAPEYAQQRRDREGTKYYDWRIYRIELPDGRYGVVCYFIDITEQVRAREKIEISERQLRLVTDAIPALISYVDSRGYYQFNNRRYEEWFGVDSRQLKGKHISDVLGEEAYERVRENVEAALSGARMQFEGHIPYRDAGLRCVRAEYVPDVQADGSVAGYFALVLDITQRKMIEDSLRKRNHELSLLAATSQDLVFGGTSEQEMLQVVFDRTLEALDMEIYFNFIVGDDPESLIMTSSSGLSDEQKEAFSRIRFGDFLCGDVARRREPVVIESLQRCQIPEASALRADGVRCYVGLPLIARDQLLGTIAFATRRRDSLHDGELQLIQTICDQVAATLERGRLFEGLRQSEERARTLVSVVSASEERMQLAMTIADAGTWDLDLITNTLHWSESHFRLLGYEPTLNHEATMEMWQSTIVPEDYRRLMDEWQRAQRDRDLFHCEHRIVRKDGEQIWASAAGKFFYDDEGQAIRFIGVFFDVTASKKAEQALKDADRRKDEFLATLAHELRNPLAPIRNGLHIMQMTTDSKSENHALIEMMERQVTHMVRLVDDLLEVSRITRGKIELRKEKIELASIFRSAVETARPFVDSLGHRLIVELPNEAIWLDADPVRLAQIVSNLLNNAAKYTEEGGKIWLCGRVSDNRVVISVKDTGMGIPAEMLPRVFELFTQIDRTLGRSQGGLGIGLALVKNLVELHGGCVEVQSDGPGAGSEFMVTLPTLMDVESSSLESSTIERNGTPAIRKKKVLVVDDNRDAADTLAMLLRAIGADVQTAYTGQQALDFMRGHCPDVVFLDIGMPEMDGYDVARQIRSDAMINHVALIALTGWGQDEDRRRSRDAGFDHHLTKPPDIDEVKMALSTIIHSPMHS